MDVEESGFAGEPSGRAGEPSGRAGEPSRRAGTITLFLGGARSGKSELAEALAGSAAGRDAGQSSEKVVTYLATAAAAEDDADMARRIAEHAARRPHYWHTVEVSRGGDLARALEAAGPQVALVDSLGTWVAGWDDFEAPIARLLEALERRAEEGRDTIVVSEEVGLGVHPTTEAGRAFRDALGSANREVAEIATRVVLVIAGRALELQAGRA